MRTVRDGKKVAPYCPECGCRLQQMPSRDWGWIELSHFVHPHYETGKDARDHYCSLWAKTWDILKRRVYSPN